jgi:site-specific DNA-methyltransferase (adenine-specific)
MVFADPPYFLSNNGLSIQSGKIVSVNKGKWDKSEGFEFINDFNRKWLSLVRDKMKEDATIWISGTMHNIFSVGQILNELGFKILNNVLGKRQIHHPIFRVDILHIQPNKSFGQEKAKKFLIISTMN